jgi:PiT family inorganic phosphate transporter
MEHLILIIAVVAALYMAWNIGANDVANAMGTSVGSGAITLRQAVLIAAIFEFSGAFIFGSHVTETVRKGMLDPLAFATSGPFGAQGPVLLALGMTAALLAAAIWLQLSTKLGLPVSTTHSIVGAVIGFGVLAVGIGGVRWGEISQIVASWFVSPIMGGLLGFGIFLGIRAFILRNPDPIAATARIAPYLVMAVCTILALTFTQKVLHNLVRDPHPTFVALAALGFGGVGALIARALIKIPETVADADPYPYVERIFGGLQVVTAAFVAFAHGANDVANAVGPLAAVVGIARTGFTDVPDNVPLARWILAVGGIGIVIGLAMWGYKVIATVGRHITEITPSRGFSAEFATACTVLLASRMGLPVSTTHVLVGAVIGVGLAHGLGALNLRTITRIMGSWIATLPAAAAISAVLFLVLRAMFVT